MDDRSPVEDLYVYAYPLLLMDITRQQQTAVAAPEGIRAPSGQFAHVRAFPDDTFQAVVSPNADTLYSSAFFDLGDGPVVLSLPDTMGRYYLMPMYDAWSNIFASPGARTTGTRAGDYAIVGPGWEGILPDGLQRIDAPTENVWIIGRTQTNGTDDYACVHALQDQISLTPLSAWGSGYAPPANSPVDPTADCTTTPVDQVARMPPEVFWPRFASLLGDNPPARCDGSMVERLAAAGIEAGKPIEWSALSAEQQALLTQATIDGLAAVEAAGHSPPIEIRNTWAGAYHLGAYGTDYLLRAAVARVGLGANLPKDAIYPMARGDHEGQPLSGEYCYVMHFDSDELPPVHGFWSITMYNARQLFVKNPIGRYAIGDRDDLIFDEDGSLDLYIQHESPGCEREANWLPAPEGSFNLIARLYWPGREVLDGTWVPPRVTRVG